MSKLIRKFEDIKVGDFIDLCQRGGDWEVLATFAYNGGATRGVVVTRPGYRAELHFADSIKYAPAPKAEAGVIYEHEANLGCYHVGLQNGHLFREGSCCFFGEGWRKATWQGTTPRTKQ